MGQFKPMVKMMTTEPSVILKLKKGGKVASKMDGGYMPMQSTMPAQMSATSGAPSGMAPKRPSMMARRRAMNPLLSKKGGDVSCEKVEKELKQHEAKPMGKAHKKASGGAIDKAETKTTVKGNAGKYLNTKVVDGDKTDKAHGTKGIKTGNAGGYANGGTIKGNAGKYLNTKVVDGDKADKAHGTTGVKMGNAGGFRSGGKVNWENLPANTAKAGVSNTTTGEVKEANAGGFKKGGSAKKAFATGGKVDSGKAVKMPKHFVSRPVANSLQSGTFKKGGEVKKADGGSTKNASLWTKINPNPKEKYLRVNEPVNPNYSETAVNKAIASSNRSGRKINGKEAKAIHSLLKGRYAGGGNAKKYAEGSSVTPAGDPKVVTDKASRELEEALNPLSMAKEGFQKIKDYFINKPAPAGSVTKTEKSVTVAPSRKRGGRA